MDRRPPNLWFIGAWLLLVVCIAAGFYVQQHTIDELHDTQDAIREFVMDEADQDLRVAQTLCLLFLDLAPDSLDGAVTENF